MHVYMFMHCVCVHMYVQVHVRVYQYMFMCITEYMCFRLYIHVCTCVCVRALYILYASTCSISLFSSQEWRKLQTSEKTPQARRSHTASVITGHPPQLMVVGGWGGRVFSDVWILVVAEGRWSEVLHAHVQ